MTRRTQPSPIPGAAGESYRPDETAALAQRLHDHGLVYAVNRLVLHPLGMALGVAGKGTPADFKVTGLALFLSDDPEGIVFAHQRQHELGMARVKAAAEANEGQRGWAYGRVLDRLAERDAFGDEDSAGAEAGRLEADLVEIDRALVDAGYEGAVNAESIIERIGGLVADRPSEDQA